jgi:hypothetical protein
VFTRVGFHFFSYKLGRVLLPWALLLIAASSFWLPGAWAWLAVGGQGCLYGLAAALCAGSILFVPAGSLLKETRVKAAE